MYSARFTPLNQNDDYKLHNMPHGSPQYTSPTTYQQQMHQQQYMQQQASQHQPHSYHGPPIKPAYDPHVTYVSTPIDNPYDDSKQFNHKNRRKSSRLSFLANPVSNFKIPTFAAPWQHESVGTPPDSSKLNTVRYFNRKKQWWRLFTNGLIQWMMTLTIVGMIVAALWGFAHIEPMSRWQRYTFNTVITLLSLCLGLAVVSALRSYAKLLSWRFLATEYRDLQDFELIMNCDSQSKVLKLLWAGRSPGKFGINRTQLLCLTSLALVIGLQIVIALMGLTYSVETSDVFVGYKPGNVSLVDLSDIRQKFWQDVGDTSETPYAYRTAAANLYGTVGSEFTSYIEQPGAASRARGTEGYTGAESVGMTTDGLDAQFFYQFVEWSTAAKTKVWGPSGRYIQSDASCVELEILSGGYNIDYYMNYYDEQGVNRTQYVSASAALTSTYMANQSDVGCGPRCTRLLVLDTGSQPSDGDEELGVTQYYKPHLYACNSSISEVYHSATTCTHKEDCDLPDDLARIVAGAIGFSGTWYDDEDMQFKLYSAGSQYSWSSFLENKNATVQSYLVRMFTTAVIAAMDDIGPRISLPGREPTPGMVLEVKWIYTIPVLAVVPGLQLIVLIIVCLYANGAMVKDGSYLATARLLRPVVDKLGEHGCALTGDEIARELGNYKIIYGARAPKARPAPTTAYSPGGATSVDWHAGIIAESEGYGRQAEEGWLPGRTWPAGQYDGEGYSDEISEEGVEIDVIDEKAHLL